VTPWSQQVREALRNPSVLAGVAQVATAWMEEHIANNEGRGKSGNAVRHKPLKKMKAEYWTFNKPKGARAKSHIKVGVIVNGKTRQRKFYLVERKGFRTGGQPLRDTGKLAASLGARAEANGTNIRLTMQGRKYGLYQDRGFTTKGPNYIPLTMRGRRGHGTGNNPNREGLEYGNDYIMAWGGVTVPARPFILPTREDLRVFGTSIYLGLKAVLKGT